MTSHLPPNGNAVRDPLPQVVLFVLRHDATPQPSLDRLQVLLFLVDREHARAFGIVLTYLPWVREPSGPRTQALLPVLDELDRASQLPPGLLPSLDKQRRIAESPAVYAPDAFDRFSPRVARSLQRVMWKYGQSANGLIHETIESTRSYQQAAAGDPIDLSHERAWLIEEVDRQGVDRRQWGDPAASAAEDEEIMAALAGWRAEANRELLDE